MSYFEIIERLQGYLVSKSADVEPLTDGDKSFKERLPVLRAVIPQRSVILLVDDDPDQVAIFKRALTAAGYTVVTANSAVTLFASSSTRSYLLVQVTTGSAFVNVGATATTVNGINLTAGQGYAWETTIPQGLVSLISTTTSSRWVAKEA